MVICFKINVTKINQLTFVNVLIMMIINQCATNQWNEKGEAVSYWCKKRCNWITYKTFRQFHPFTTEFVQPYKSKEEFQKLNPKWQIEYNKPM